MVIQAVRLEMDPLYRFHEGVVLLCQGDMVFGNTVTRREYKDPDWLSVAQGPTLREVRTAVRAEALAQGFQRYDDLKPFLLDVPMNPNGE